jgi:histidinol-phosphate aminotransferase
MSIRPRRSLTNSTLQRPSVLGSVPRSQDLMWLDKNENLDPVLLALTEGVLSSIPSIALATYPEAGCLYRKLAKWVGVAPEALLLTPGSDGAIRLVFEAFVEHGDSVVHSSPTFAMYPVYSQMFGAEATVIEYSRTEDGPYLDPSFVLKALRAHKPKLLCLPNPDSPTGTVLNIEDLKKILETCEAVGTVLLLDEAYYPFYEWSAVSWTKNSRNLIVARTFAKSWGLAGLRIGYAVAHQETIALLHKIRPMYETSTLAIEFMTRMLDHTADVEQSVSRVMAGKKYFHEAMQTLGFKSLLTEGNFIHVAFGAQSKVVHEALSDLVLYRKSFDHPSLADYSRFSVAPKVSMTKVVNLITKIMEKTS